MWNESSGIPVIEEPAHVDFVVALAPIDRGVQSDMWAEEREWRANLMIHAVLQEQQSYNHHQNFQHPGFVIYSVPKAKKEIERTLLSLLALEWMDSCPLLELKGIGSFLAYFLSKFFIKRCLMSQPSSSKCLLPST